MKNDTLKNDDLNESLTSKFAGWVEELKESGSYYSEDARLEITESLYTLMQKHNVSKAELARRLKTSRGYITKLLQGNENLTIDSICKVAHALGYKLKNIEFVPLEQSSRLNSYEDFSNYKRSQTKLYLEESNNGEFSTAA